MSLLQKVNMKNVIFLTDYEDQCFLDDLKLYRIKGRFFKIASFKIPIESMDIPYLFVIDKDFIINKIYIRHNSMTDQTLSYLKYLQIYMK